MLEVLFPADHDIDSWAARHRSGAAPGLWPYGLDGLRGVDAEARISSLAKPSRFEAARARLLRRRRPRPGSSLDQPTIGLTWDENSGRVMALTRPRERMYTGVIWITDLAARGKDTGRMREILREMDGLWVISRGQLEPLRDFVGEDGPPIVYFRFGIDSAFFGYSPYPKEPLVVSVGGDHDRYRDVATLFASLERVHAEAPEARIIVQTTSGLTPPVGVTTIDHLDHLQLAALYERASVVAVATTDNLHGSGMTVALESMSTGRPVVMTKTPGIDDYIDNELTGLLVPVGDAGALAAGVVRLLSDPEESERFGMAGRVAVETGLTTEHMVQSMAAFLGLPDLGE